jgi:transcriptional regulator with XRE-family HTH domain
MNLGKAIGVIREMAGLKQAEMARLISISKNAMSSIELGKSKPSDTNLAKIAEVLKVEVSFIYLLAIDPEKDMSDESRAKFNKLFPDFNNKLLTFVK